MPEFRSARSSKRVEVDGSEVQIDYSLLEELLTPAVNSFVEGVKDNPKLKQLTVNSILASTHFLLPQGVWFDTNYCRQRLLELKKDYRVFVEDNEPSYRYLYFKTIGAAIEVCIQKHTPSQDYDGDIVISAELSNYIKRLAKARKVSVEELLRTALNIK